MATSDLCEILKKHAAVSTAHRQGNDVDMSDVNHNISTSTIPIIDAQTEKKICEAVLRRVDDKSNDVQAIAVKTLAILVTCVHEGQVVEIAKRLGALVLDESKSALRDVYTIGLRTLVNTVPVEMGDVVSNQLTTSLLNGIIESSQKINSNSDAKEDRDAAKVAEEIHLACLDILTEVLNRFGSMRSLTKLHENLVLVMMRGLSSKSHLIRKRTGTTLGFLSVVLSDDHIRRLVDTLLSQIDRADGIGKSGKRKANRQSVLDTQHTDGENKPLDTAAFIRAMCSLSGHVGHRLTQEQIDRLVPIFLVSEIKSEYQCTFITKMNSNFNSCWQKFCDPSDALAGDDMDDDDTGGSDEMMEEDEEANALANELRESCFNGFQSLVLRRPEQIQSHLRFIVHAALAYMRYDPNYSYGDEIMGDDDQEEGDDEYDMDDDENEYDDEEDEFSDEDDDSWKVRRSAIRTLAAIVKSSEKNLSSLWNVSYSLKKNKKWKATVADALVNRFKERDENCRVDIIECFDSLLKLSVTAASKGYLRFSSSEGMDIEGDIQTVNNFRSVYVKAIVSGCEKQFQAKKSRFQTKSAALSLLSTLCTAPGGIGDAATINSMFQSIKSIFTADTTGSHGHGSNKQLILDALCLVNVVMTCGQHDPMNVKNGLLEVLLSELCKTVQENWYKIMSETLIVLSRIPILLTEAKSSEEEVKATANALYDAIEPRLAANDFDQEVKENALGAAASLFSSLHLHLSQQQKERLLSLILLRLKNETTRIPAMKTIKELGQVDLGIFLTELVTELATLLLQHNRNVKQHAIICLTKLITLHGTSSIEAGNSEIMNIVMRQLSENVSENFDLNIIHLSLQASLTILDQSTSCTLAGKEHLLPAVLHLCTSSILQDKAFESLLAVLQKFISCNIISFNELLSSLHAKLPQAPQTDDDKGLHTETIPRRVIGNIATCMATITVTANDIEKREVVSNLVTSLEADVTVDTLFNTVLALRMTGDLGCIVDLNDMENAGEKLLLIFANSFDSHFEDIKSAAAYGLGRASVGSINLFLPKILTALEAADDKKKYLLLSSIRELIHCHRLGYGSDIASIVEQILPHLKLQCSNVEEGVRTMVAECMGSLACLKPDEILSELQELQTQNSSDTHICWTVATSAKVAISNGCDGNKLKPHMSTFLSLLNTEDLNVKHAALLMVYGCCHHNPDLILTFMESQIEHALLEVCTTFLTTTLILFFNVLLF